MHRRKLLTCAVSAVALQLAGCVTPMDPTFFDPRLMQRPEREEARLDIPERMPPMPTTQEDPLGDIGDLEAGTTRPVNWTGPTTGPSLGYDGEPIMRLSLQDAIQRAVLYNHDVRVAGYEPAIDASRVVEAEGQFDPVLFANLQIQQKDDETGGSIVTDPTSSSGLNTTSFFQKQDIDSAVEGVKQNLTSGAQIQVDYNTSYNSFIPQQFVDNPFIENRVEFQITQPLLRNFGDDVNQARIFISRNDSRVSLLEFRKALEDNVAKVEETYWQLVEIRRNVAVEEFLLQENEKSYGLEYSRLKEKLISSLEVSQVQTSLESRRATLIRAKADARDLSDQLKQLMNDPNLPVSSPVLIEPADTPVTQPMHFDIDDQVNSGMENRFELGEQLLKIDTATLTYGVAKNNTLPKLDLVGSAAPNSVSGDYRAALNDEVKFGHFEYGVGLEFEFPIGNREALAILRRTQLQREEAIEKYSALMSQVALDVRQAAREVDTTYKLILTNRQSRFAAERALADEVERQEKGSEPLTPEFVQLRLDLADRLGQSREAENQAVANYNISL